MSTCAVVAACEFNADDFLMRWKAGAFDFVIAADAGLAHLDAVGCAPDLVVGDFDSLGYVPDGENVECHPAHKDESDMELALRIVSEHGFDVVAVYGAFGGRLDHTLANIQICARLAEIGIDVLAVGLDAAMKILVGPGTYELPPLAVGTVSVFSAVDEAHDVTERGLEYPLEHATLTNRTTLGLSNELIGQPASVSVGQGTLLIFHPLA